MSVWNRWRARYDTMSWADQKAFHAKFADTEQTHFTRIEALRFAANLPAGSRVLEIGGWKGEMADFVLPDAPQLAEWLNVEVLEAALKHKVRDPRYHVLIPDDFIWKVGLPIGYDALLMSHTLEHMRGIELEQIINQFDGSTAYLEAPLDDPQHADGWNEYPGSHITELLWPDLDRLMAEQDFTKDRFVAGQSHDTMVATYSRTIGPLIQWKIAEDSPN